MLLYEPVSIKVDRVRTLIRLISDYELSSCDNDKDCSMVRAFRSPRVIHVNHNKSSKLEILLIRNENYTWTKGTLIPELKYKFPRKHVD